MRRRGLTCHEVVQLVTDYLEDALPRKARRRVEEHLALCDGCATYLDQMRETIRLTGMIREEEIPEEERQRLLQAFRGWAR